MTRKFGLRRDPVLLVTTALITTFCSCQWGQGIFRLRQITVIQTYRLQRLYYRNNATTCILTIRGFINNPEENIKHFIEKKGSTRRDLFSRNKRQN